MTTFTPYSALLGGFLIGLSAALLLLLNGRIAGISGILGGIVSPKSGDMSWRIHFVAGLLLGPLLLKLLGIATPSVEIQGNWGLWVSAGLLVGYGTKMANGCTSGHGVCGIARWSIRSIVATLLFMAVAGVTVYVMRHLINVATLPGHI